MSRCSMAPKPVRWSEIYTAATALCSGLPHRAEARPITGDGGRGRPVLGLRGLCSAAAHRAPSLDVLLLRVADEEGALCGPS